jgi:hypothetical protein
VQRFDSGLRLNVHFHVLALDGVYVRDTSGAPVFHALPAPTENEVADVARRTAERVHKLLVHHGRVGDCLRAERHERLNVVYPSDSYSFRAPSLKSHT